MSTEKKEAASHVMVAGGVCLDANTLNENGEGLVGGEAIFNPMVTILVAMPLVLKRKLHVEAKRRQQSLSEFVCAKCDFQEELS